MTEYIGDIAIPEITPSGTFPVVSDYGYGHSRRPQAVVHRFGSANAKIEQRFYLGSGAKQFHVHRAAMREVDRKALRDFWETQYGAYGAFTYNAPNDGGVGTTAYICHFANEPFGWEFLTDAISTVGVTLVELPTTNPSYTLNGTYQRFPPAGLQTALLAQVQEIIPLIKIQPRETGYPTIYVSDRRCTIGGQLYVPRLIDWDGISQAIGNESDEAQFIFGNADRVMTLLVNDTDLFRASLEFSLFHVGTGYKLDLWKGEINDWSFDAGELFRVRASDGIYELRLPYPTRKISRTCWKCFNDALGCPYATQGAMDYTHFPHWIAKIDTITLTGTSGTADITLAGGLTKTLTFHTSLTITASDFVTANAVAYATQGITLTSSTNHLIFTSATVNLDFVSPVITNKSGDLNGSVAHTQAFLSGSDPSCCDKGYESANSCLAHGMKHYFGGLIAEPQGVKIKDNSTGTWGFGRSTVMSTSIVDDSIYDEVIPEVYTNNESWVDSTGKTQTGMPVKAKIASGRDESDFYDCLAVVGEGPLEFSSELTKFTLDGKYCHDYPHTHWDNGLRLVIGSDPPGSIDFFSLSANGTYCPTFRIVTYLGKVYKDNFSAGTAFCELRRDDDKGMQYSWSKDHEMKVSVLTGLKGWVWTGAGARTWSVMSNPTWIAINIMLKARGLRYASAAVCETYFDITAAIAAATICDKTVACLIGTGTETQFKFRGTLNEEKPLRDWIQEVLMNCLGYYSFAFGKLKLGVRENSSVIEAFTEGNIIFQSLQLAALNPTFNHLVAQFGDREYEFAQNAIDVYDLNHAQLIGGATAPLFLKSDINLCGTYTKSQAARIICTRLREELGGTSAIQWMRARKLGFKTTVLALNTEPGMVCSMTHPDMPDGVFNGVPQPTYGEFRIMGWKLNKDYSIDVNGQTTVDEMYNLIAGPKPADVGASPIPIEYSQMPLGLVWQPDAEYPLASDPLRAIDDGSFKISQVYTELADESLQLELAITGKLPVNKFIDAVVPPIIRTATVATTGGSLLGDRSYFVCICARDANGDFSPPSNIMKVQIPAGTNTNKITLENLVWPGAFTGYDVFGAIDDEQMITHQLTNTGMPSSIVITAAFSRSTYSLPSPMFNHLRLKIKRLPKVGVRNCEVLSVSGNDIFVTDAYSGDDWTGRDISLISTLSNTDIPIRNYHVTAWDGVNKKFTVSPTPSGIMPSDILAIRAMPTAACGSNTITDDKFVNVYTPNGLEDQTGNLVRIIAGTGRGQIRRIESHTSTVITIDTAWDITPDTTSRFIIENPLWEFFTETNPTENSDRTLATLMSTIVSNQKGTSFLVQAVAVDNNGDESPDSLSPYREIFINMDLGNPSGASNLQILTHVNDSSIPRNQVAFTMSHELNNYSTIIGVAIWLSSALPAEGPFVDQRTAHPAIVIETGTCKIAAGSKAVQVTRASNPNVLQRVLYTFSNDATPDTDLTGEIIVGQGTNSLILNNALTRSGQFSYVIIKRFWDVGVDTTNGWYMWFPKDQLLNLQQPTWRTPNVALPEGKWYVTATSRNAFGLGTELTAGPVVITFDNVATNDSDNPSGCSGLVILTHADDSRIPVGNMAFRWNRDTSNYDSIYAAQIALTASLPAHGPYYAQRNAYPADVITSGSGLAIVAGDVEVPLAYGSDLTGKVLLIFTGGATSDAGLDGNVIKSWTASKIILSKAFYKSGTFYYAVVVPWWGLNAYDRTFWLSPTSEFITNVQDLVWQTKPVPIFTGTWYSDVYSRNVYGVSQP
jgi:hypothetical protein